MPLATPAIPYCALNFEEAFNSTVPTCNSHPTAADNQSNHRKGTTRLIDQASKGSCPSKYCQENTAATFDLFTQMQSCHVAFSKENHEHFVIRYRPESETNADKLGWKKVGALEPGSCPFFTQNSEKYSEGSKSLVSRGKSYFLTYNVELER